jgi:hypothetical protein
LLALLRLFFSSRAALLAENLFLRKRLALFHERKTRPRRITPAGRVTWLTLAQFFDWRQALVIVMPETFLKWHRTAFRILCRWKSRQRGRPSLRKNIRDLIRRMHRENPTWGEERIANELSLKLALRISPRTVRKYLDGGPSRGKTTNLRWSAFVRNHARAIVACDFFVSVAAGFRVLYVFVAAEVGSRRILHTNATAHPTAEWTIQQFREFLAFDHPYRFVIHDRDSIFSPGVDLYSMRQDSLLTKPNTCSTIEEPASLRSENCSPSARNAVCVPFGISVHLQRNPQEVSDPKAQGPSLSRKVPKRGRCDGTRTRLKGVIGELTRTDDERLGADRRLPLSHRRR